MQPYGCMPKDAAAVLRFNNGIGGQAHCCAPGKGQDLGKVDAQGRCAGLLRAGRLPAWEHGACHTKHLASLVAVRLDVVRNQNREALRCSNAPRRLHPAAGTPVGAPAVHLLPPVRQRQPAAELLGESHIHLMWLVGELPVSFYARTKQLTG